ncbi:Transposon Ty3-G Gag-Pol polyprotein [Trametes pubescens]|uniref:Transposon Ty3-G Gag-Pol polyprotein n=1 Tax=Trametes pubescens TaxID=154538 RepID=A0A1M2V1Y0_TRAPU|nr:Transposon Ty3-G Gag-Pol polyprotein [Trametes pubescens]
MPEKEVLQPPEVIPALCEKWFAACANLIGDIPLELPPMREINHRIPIIDEDKQYNYHHPRCPDAARPELLEKWNRYVEAGWWEMKPTSQAAPLLCVLKKNGKLRTVIDARQQNDNTYKDMTPFPDQDNIRIDVAHTKFCLKIDMSDAYKQIQIEVEDIGKTAFSTIFGTAISHVMQQGDCNAPRTFQWLMMWIFREYIGVFVHVYLDDIFMYSNSIEEHKHHLKLVFDRLREQQLYLSRSKLDLYSEWMDCLGHVIDNRGLCADTDKMATIRDWRPPHSQVEVQHFLGLVQYLAHFLPDVSAYTSPLETCMDHIKDLACQASILKPIDPAHEDTIWLITDRSVIGVGAVYGQGPDWKTCRPVGFMLKKFTSVQRSYRTYEHEALGIIEALMKWEVRLLGRRFKVAMDHETLVKMHQSIHDMKSSWLIWWDKYLSRFDFEIVHLDGVENKVVDCLS